MCSRMRHRYRTGIVMAWLGSKLSFTATETNVFLSYWLTIARKGKRVADVVKPSFGIEFGQKPKWYLMCLPVAPFPELSFKSRKGDSKSADECEEKCTVIGSVPSFGIELGDKPVWQMGCLLNHPFSRELYFNLGKCLDIDQANDEKQQPTFLENSEARTEATRSFKLSGTLVISRIVRTRSSVLLLLNVLFADGRFRGGFPPSLSSSYAAANGRPRRFWTWACTKR